MAINEVPGGAKVTLRKEHRQLIGLLVLL